MIARVAAVGAALLALLLSACGTCGEPDAFGRYPVTLVVVDSVAQSPAIPGNRVVARTVAPDRIEIRRDWAWSERLVAHELRHVVQWNEVGADFLVVYWLQVVTHGYEDAPFEVEAREAESSTWYRAWARDVIATLDE